jgi:hypothetical protein
VKSAGFAFFMALSPNSIGEKIMATLETQATGFEPTDVASKDSKQQADAYFALSVKLADGSAQPLQDQKCKQYNLISLHADALSGMIGKLIEKLDSLPSDEARADWLSRNLVINYRKPVTKKTASIDMFAD